jgi:hypothetical protein
MIKPERLQSFLWLFLCFCAATVLPAQNRCYVHLSIIDAQTQEPLEGVSLKIDGRPTQLFTDSAGLVRILVTCEPHNVRLTYVGYKPYTRKLDCKGDVLTAIQLDNINTQMEEVVITSQGSVRNIETPALGVNILSMRAVQKISPAAGEVDILRSLQTLPGISSVGEGANGINIRGGSVEQNLILLDNMPIYNPTHLLGLFSLFPNDAIREMQIYKGSVPARYGGRTAGVLDVKMSEPSTEKFKILGGAGLISNRFHVEIPIKKDKIAWMTSARFSYTNYLIQLYNRTLVGTFSKKRIPDANPIFFDLANKVIWRVSERDHISLVNYISYDSYNIDTLFSIAGITPRQANMEYGHNNFAARWNHYFSDQLNLNVLAVRSHYFTSTAAMEVQSGFDYNTRLNNNNGKAEITYLPSARTRINAGLTIGRYDIRPANLTPKPGSTVRFVDLPREQAWETALFASGEYDLNQHILVETGLRYVNYWNMGPFSLPVFSQDEPKSVSSVTGTLSGNTGDVESFFGRLEPRVAVRIKLDANKAIKLGYNRMNQFLQQIANSATPLPNVRWKTANRYVPPNQSDLVSAGYFHDTPNRMYEWSLEGYYRWQNAIFDYSNGAELNINPLLETQLLKGKARAYGTELFVNKKKGVMTGWMSYTYARSFQKITGDFPALQQLNDGEWFRSNIDKPHTINILLTFQTEKHNAASFTFVYSTGRPYTAPVSFFPTGSIVVPVYTDRNNARISDYHRLDFSWTITNPSMKDRRWEGSWIVTLYNIYGRKNAYSYFFNPNLAYFRPSKVSVFPTPIFSITYNFKFE